MIRASRHQKKHKENDGKWKEKTMEWRGLAQAHETQTHGATEEEGKKDTAGRPRAGLTLRSCGDGLGRAESEPSDPIAPSFNSTHDEQELIER